LTENPGNLPGYNRGGPTCHATFVQDYTLFAIVFSPFFDIPTLLLFFIFYVERGKV